MIEPPNFKEINRMMADMERRRNEWRREHPDRNQYIKDQAVEVGTLHGFEYWIVPGPKFEKEAMEIAPSLADISGGYNGYAVFPQNWIKERHYGGILDYVPVHWGVTYNEVDNMGQVLGFDTAHSNSSEFPRRNLQWIRDQISMMIKGINMAHGVERQYLTGTTRRQKAYYAQKVYECGNPEERGMGVMLNILSGQI